MDTSLRAHTSIKAFALILKVMENNDRFEKATLCQGRCFTRTFLDAKWKMDILRQEDQCAKEKEDRGFE